jgi:hypothetical protein
VRRRHLTEAVGADVAHVVAALADDDPHDVADLTFAVVVGESCERGGVDELVRRQLRHVLQRCTLGLGEERARPVPLQRVEALEVVFEQHRARLRGDAYRMLRRSPKRMTPSRTPGSA